MASSSESELDEVRAAFSAALKAARDGQLFELGLVTHELISDGSNKWLAELVRTKQVHEEDYRAFANLPAPGLILDVGANYGYSVTSLRAVGLRNAILSVEALPILEPHLAFIKASLDANYDYVISAVGARPGTVKLTTPVVNGVALTALSSADPGHLDDRTLRNLLNYCTSYLRQPKPWTLRFAITETPVTTVDAIVSERGEPSIAAIKIDVEGWELNVLTGAQETIAAHRPMIMLEGPRAPGIAEFMHEAGYAGGLARGNKVVLCESPVPASNGFFFPSEQIEAYVRAGMVAQSG